MGRAIDRRRTRSRALLVTALLVCLVAFSLAVRWLGLGGRFSPGPESAFQIEVLNGTKEAGAAMVVAKELRLINVDVLIIDNAERFDFKESILVDRAGNPRLMRKLAKMLGCRTVLEQISPAPLVDATYIIGYDRVKRGAGSRS
jgi:hypothetical protein